MESAVFLAEYEKQHPGIREILLGKYVFGDKVTVMFPDQTGNDLPILTEYHEGIHRHICSVTSFGLFQRSLGLLIADGGLPDSIRREYLSLLDKTVNASWISHEGIATACELPTVLSHYGYDRFHEYRAKLPIRYRFALEPFSRLLTNMQMPSIAAAAFCQAIAHVVFATNIFEVIADPQTVHTLDWGAYFTKRDNSPDSRLEVLFCEVFVGEGPAQISEKIKGIICAHLGTLDLIMATNKFLHLPMQQHYVLLELIIDTVAQFLIDRVPYNVRSGFYDKAKALNEPVFRAWMLMLSQKGVILHKNYIFRDMSKTTEDQIEYAVGSTEYQPAFSEAICVNIMENDGLWELLAKQKSEPYVLLVGNVLDKDYILDDKGLMVLSPGGLYIRMHGVIAEFNSLCFTSPIGAPSPYDTQPIGFIVEEPQINRVMEKLVCLNSILTMSEIMYRILQTNYERFSPFFNIPLQVFLQPMSTTLEYWNSMISEMTKTSTVELFHFVPQNPTIRVVGIRSSASAAVYCSPVATDLPTLLVSKWKGKPGIVACGDAQDVLTQDVLAPVRIFCDHFSRFGW